MVLSEVDGGRAVPALRRDAESYELTVDLEAQVGERRRRIPTRIRDRRVPAARCCCSGLDEIGRTLLEEPLIAAFERRRGHGRA